MKIVRRTLVISLISLGLVVIIIYYFIRLYLHSSQTQSKKVPDVSTRSIIKSATDSCMINVIYQRGDELCIWGHSNPVPKTDREMSRSGYNGGSIRINGHPFMFYPNGVLKIHRPWWQFSRCHFIMRGYESHPGHYFIQNDEGLFYVSSNSVRHLTESLYDRLIFYEEVPYVLIGGRLYKCMNYLAFNTSHFILRTNQWDLEPVNFIGGFDIRFMDIVDLSCADNDELILIVSSGRVLYIPTSRESDLVNERYLKDVLRGVSKYSNPFQGIRLDLECNVREIVTNIRDHMWKRLPIHRIELGNTSDIFIIFYNHSISVIRNDRILVTIDGIYKAIWGPPEHPNIIYVIDLSGNVCEYDIKIGITSRRILCRHMKDIDIAGDVLLMISRDNVISNLS